MKFQVIGNFYFDIDNQNQLRIAGPDNHLFLGFKFLSPSNVFIDQYQPNQNQISLQIATDSNRLEISKPLVCDIRTLRKYTEGQTKMNYQDLIQQSINEVQPITTEKKSSHLIKFSRQYQDDNGQLKYYGAQIITDQQTQIIVKKNTIQLDSTNPTFKFKIQTFSNLIIEEVINSPILLENVLSKFDNLPEKIQQLFHQSGEHITHLITNKKTSSFEYGTIFPRDWIESAQLGFGDLSRQAIDYMFEQSLKHVDETGQGWHEDLIGEYKYKQEQKNLIDRKMIDIEPLYLLGMELVSKEFLLKSQNSKKLKAIAQYLIGQAQDHQLITFKKKADQDDDFYEVGNWRDSVAAFPQHQKPLAPYDVNCVFYPVALKIISKYDDFFAVNDQEKINLLIKKFSQNSQKFLISFKDGIKGYCLALHGNPPLPLSLTHLDESYNLFYNHPTLEETLDLAAKLVSAEYFFTPVGPLLIGAETKYLSEKHYHGKVIWPKQAAFAVAGLTKQYKIGKTVGWPDWALKKIKHAVLLTSESCFQGWQDLEAVSELYYYDKKQNKARFYLDQDEIEGQMSVIQLWSAVGCRRIVRDYLEIKSLT